MIFRRFARYLPFVLVCGLLAGAVTYLIVNHHRTYSATAVIAVNPNNAAAELVSGTSSSQQVDVAQYVTAQVPYLTSDQVLNDANAIVEKQVHSPLGSISASGDQTAQTLSVTASAPKAAVAVDSANAVVRAYGIVQSQAAERLVTSAIASLASQLTALRRQLNALANNPSTPAGERAAVGTRYQQAYQQRQNLIAQRGTVVGGYSSIFTPGPGDATASAPWKLGALGAVLGILIVGLLALLREQSLGLVRSASDARAAIPSVRALAQIPRLRRRDADGLVSGEVMDQQLSESLRRLRVGLLSARPNGIGGVVVASADHGEGRSFIAMHLAASWAAVGRSVLLVGTDLRRPDLGRHLGLPSADGLTNLIDLGSGDEGLSLEDVKELVLDTEQPGLSVLASGTLLGNPVDLLERPAAARLFNLLTENWDLVVFDSPPILSYSDASLVSQHVDSILLVAAVGSTRRNRLTRAVAAFGQRPASEMFLVVNQAVGDPSAYIRSEPHSDVPDPAEIPPLTRQG